MLGIYEIHIRKIAFDTGIDKDTVGKIFDRFSKDGKATYTAGHVILHNFLKHQNLNHNMAKSAVRTFNDLPSAVKQKAKSEGFVKDLEQLDGDLDEIKVVGGKEQEEEESANDTGDEYPDACKYLDEAKELASHLLFRIIEWKPDHKYSKSAPSLDRWILDIERMIRLDGRDPKAIKAIIDYTFKKSTRQAQFWSKNIWSGGKLRDKYDRLVSDYKDEQKSRNNGSTKKSRTDQVIESGQAVINDS